MPAVLLLGQLRQANILRVQTGGSDPRILRMLQVIMEFIHAQMIICFCGRWLKGNYSDATHFGWVSYLETASSWGR